jgi:hypothetical protein
LQRYGVYSKVQGIPEVYKAVDTKWVYVIKRNPNRSIEKFKARKVGRGFSQEKSINYDKTYAQMARLETWQVMLTVTLSKGWKIPQSDVVAAYLQAKLEHTVYITDLNEEGKIEYWILHKALYRLKQAAHEWSKKLKQILEYAGFQQCISDEGCFVSINGSAILLEHVDDLGITAPTENKLEEIEQKIGHVELERRDQKGLVGMEVTITDHKIWLTQTRLIERIVQQIGVIGKKSSPFSDLKDYEEISEEDEPADLKKYQQLIGSLLFIARGTRPDISVPINLFGRQATKPGIQNYKTVLRVLGYLYLTKLTGLRLQKYDHLEAEIATNASYPGEQAKGTTDIIVRLGNQTIHWYTRRQQVTSLSNSESEYIAAAQGAKDASWTRQLLEEMKIRSTIEPIILLMDNDAAQKLSQDTTYRQRTRHIDNRYHYIQEQVGKRYLIVKGTPGKTNPADPLTKLISAPCLKEWMKEIGILEWIGARSI